MAEILLDGLEIESPEAVHDLFSQALNFPEYYGRNLDALFDCLTDQREDVTIRLRNGGALKGRFGRWGGGLLRLLRRAAGENPHVTLLEED